MALLHVVYLVRNYANIVLRARIDFEMFGELAAESRNLDGLSRAQPADVDARGRADEHINFARPVIRDNDEPEW
jgi:hypothetical protein